MLQLKLARGMIEKTKGSTPLTSQPELTEG